MNATGARLARFLPAAVFILGALLVDQAIKAVVEAYLPLQEAVPVLPMLALYRTHNLGVAFSMLSGMDGWAIVGMRIVIVAFVLWLWRGSPPERRLAHVGFALIVAGALGNIVDRFVYGHVVDYILFHTQTWSFAVFNLADSLITLGAGFVLLDELLATRRDKK